MGSDGGAGGRFVPPVWLRPVLIDYGGLLLSPVRRRRGRTGLDLGGRCCLRGKSSLLRVSFPLGIPVLRECENPPEDLCVWVALFNVHVMVGRIAPIAPACGPRLCPQGTIELPPESPDGVEPGKRELICAVSMEDDPKNSPLVRYTQKQKQRLRDLRSRQYADEARRDKSNSRALKRNKRRGRQRKLVHAQPLPQEIT